MATAKLFTVAGSSRLNGQVKIRFANDLASRIKVLARNAHTDIDLFELPHAMCKRDVIEHFAQIGYGADNPELQEAMQVVLRANPA